MEYVYVTYWSVSSDTASGIGTTWTATTRISIPVDVKVTRAQSVRQGNTANRKKNVSTW